jgi:hypothetical protein
LSPSASDEGQNLSWVTILHQGLWGVFHYKGQLYCHICHSIPGICLWGILKRQRDITKLICAEISTQRDRDGAQIFLLKLHFRSLKFQMWTITWAWWKRSPKNERQMTHSGCILSGYKRQQKKGSWNKTQDTSIHSPDHLYTNYNSTTFIERVDNMSTRSLTEFWQFISHSNEISWCSQMELQVIELWTRCILNVYLSFLCVENNQTYQVYEQISSFLILLY